MEQFRQIGEVLGSMKALMVLQDDIQMNKRQCGLLFDMFSLAFDVLSEEIKQNLKLEEKNTKWKPLEHPFKELHRIFKEGELYVKHCLDIKDWWVKAIHFHNNQDCVEFHIQNLLCYFPIAIEAVETAGEISGLDIDDMKKRRIMLSNKYDKTWNDPKLFRWKFGKQYLISQEICNRLLSASKEDRWLLLEAIKDKKASSLCLLSKQEQRLGDLLIKKLTGLESLCSTTSILNGSKDYQVRRRLGRSCQYKEIQWLGENFALRHFFGEQASLNSEISALFSLSHPNILQYFCGFVDDEKKEYFLVMELMGKDLNSYIKEICGPKRRLPFSLSAAVDIMLQIARGMEYLHSQKIYHGDLNPSNVLLKPRSSTVEGYFLAKITGFGLRNVKAVLSRSSSSPNEDETIPFIWHAPEVLAEQERPGGGCKHRYSEKADVYSFGMLCFELLTGKVPFEDGHLQGDKMSRNIRAGERPLFPFVLPKYLATMTRRCWQTDPNQRPNFSSICRMLRYIKRLIVMNPHLADPEIPSVVQVDFCDIEAGFIKKFPTDAAVSLIPITQIPFQLFSYRLAEKEKLSWSSRAKSWDSQSEVVLSSHVDEAANALDGSVSPVRDTRSVCSEMPETRRLICRKANGVIAEDHFFQARDSMSVCSGNPVRKVFPLRKSNSITSGTWSSMLMHDGKSVCSEIPEKKPLPLKKSNTIPSFRLTGTRSICSEIPEKKVPDKKISPLTKSNSARVTKDPGKLKGQRKGPTMLSPRGQSTRSTAERSPTMSERSFRFKH